VQVGGADAGGRAGAGGQSWHRWTGLVQVGGVGAGGRRRCRWAGAGGLVQVGRLTRVCADVLAQVDGAGAGGRGWCRWEGLVHAGGADALECCCANATRVNAADANAGYDASE